jgi:hypothetical protein
MYVHVHVRTWPKACTTRSTSSTASAVSSTGNDSVRAANAAVAASRLASNFFSYELDWNWRVYLTPRTTLSFHSVNEHTQIGACFSPEDSRNRNGSAC